MHEEPQGAIGAAAKLNAILVGLTQGDETKIKPAQWDQRLVDSEMAQAEVANFKALTDLRGKWSRVLMWLLCATSGFQAAFVVWVGVGWLPFEGHEVFVNTVAGELFLQIAGMGLIVVKCLFPGDAWSRPKESKGKVSVETA
ncbi:hypothetical protein BH11ARM1_BH11ARM1_04610 [soil metagenome]